MTSLQRTRPWHSCTHRTASTNSWRWGTHVPSAAARSDKTYYVKHDERWRIVAVFLESDTSAKEAIVYHNAGASGYGGSSYIDDCILRDRDHNSGWTSAADGTLEQRRYYCQNWRHDVVATIKSDGKIAERDRYLSYGTPFGSPLADATFDGLVSAADTTQVNTDWGANYHVRSDFDLSGTVGAADLAEVTANNGKTLGWGTLSDMTNVANRKGYCGYDIDIAVNKLYHVRHRVLHTELGRWLRRDPMVYVDGPNMTQALACNPPALLDSHGLCCASFTLLEPYGPFDCSSWDNTYPLPTWIYPTNIPTGAPDSWDPLYQRKCDKYRFPPNMGFPNWEYSCYCWERARIRRDYGDLTWIAVGNCANYAFRLARQWAMPQCMDDMLHCLYSCCLHKTLQPQIADDVLWAHECCFVHTHPMTPPEWADTIDDIKWNITGANCGSDFDDYEIDCQTCCRSACCQ